MSATIQTYTGREFPLLRATPKDIDPVDIAHALGMTCRYGGHCRRFYSVGEHCVLMSHALPAEMALIGLLHDAAEAYLGDVVRPLKRLLPDYQKLEAELLAVIFERFGLDPALAADLPGEVQSADTRILLDERAALLRPVDWEWFPGADRMAPLGVEVNAWGPIEAAEQWLDRLGDAGAALRYLDVPR